MKWMGVLAQLSVCAQQSQLWAGLIPSLCVRYNIERLLSLCVVGLLKLLLWRFSYCSWVHEHLSSFQMHTLCAGTE